MNDARRHARLVSFIAAWNAHDLDALMACMSVDCRYDASTGPLPDGARWCGSDAVRQGYGGLLEAFPDARWDDARHFVSGARGASEWTFRGTARDGRAVEVRGCDLFTFDGDLIAVKDSFRKGSAG